MQDKPLNNTDDPNYLRAYKNGLLVQKIEQGKSYLADCILCPRKCHVNRLEKPGGTCQTGSLARVSSYFPHFGEESCLTGNHGSGTIFFTSCNLRCVFCQNWDISHSVGGRSVSPGELAQMMLSLQGRGCHNINLVTPSHVVVPVLEALEIAIDSGLNIPLVYNTSGYDSLETLDLLNGIVDIYMPDIKFWSVRSAKRYLKAPDYPKIVQRNLKIMHSQVGDLVVDSHHLAQKGLLIRHLVMPGLSAETDKILRYIAKEISVKTAVNVMFQYHPAYKVKMNDFNEINRGLTFKERELARHSVDRAGLTRYGWL
ncbi:MAG: radical SAM protein [Candidatus Marinimicrobia bacterium]|nr:radical SAM protein [Candidatus Neomarinimicrobiota bacterium]